VLETLIGKQRCRDVNQTLSGVSGRRVGLRQALRNQNGHMKHTYKTHV
jgi:hypothetical protein